MIAFIKGNIDHISENHIVIDCGGVGYMVYVSAGTISRLSGMENVKIYTYQQVRDDGITLFGFLSYEELSMFTRLITVTGLGPKGASGLLARFSASELALAILTEDADALSKAPGIGKKTAQRIILDLKDKLKNEDAFSMGVTDAQEVLSVSGGARGDAVTALVSLGYGRSDAVKAVAIVAVDGMTTEQLLKAALKKLSAL